MESARLLISLKRRYASVQEIEVFNQRHAAAQAVANELFPAEATVEDAIVCNAKLAIAVVEGRRSAKLPLCVGQEGLNLVGQANVRLIEARGLLAEAHRAFRDTQIEVGLSAFSYGDYQECPPSKAVLRKVSAANAA